VSSSSAIGGERVRRGGGWVGSGGGVGGGSNLREERVSVPVL